jgi:DNA-binding response OmpR family regulator
MVLIVEDEEPIADALVYLVEDAGHTAVLALNGKAALELALARRPDVIFTDLMMPQMGGAELIQALRAVWNSATPPIVHMTAAGRRYMDEAGADVVLPKPFDIEDIEALLGRFLGER